MMGGRPIVEGRSALMSIPDCQSILQSGKVTRGIILASSIAFQRRVDLLLGDLKKLAPIDRDRDRGNLKMGRHPPIRREAQTFYQLLVYDQATGARFQRLRKGLQTKWMRECDLGFCGSLGHFQHCFLGPVALKTIKAIPRSGCR